MQHQSVVGVMQKTPPPTKKLFVSSSSFFSNEYSSLRIPRNDFVTLLFLSTREICVRRKLLSGDVIVNMTGTANHHHLWTRSFPLALYRFVRKQKSQSTYFPPEKLDWKVEHCSDRIPARDRQNKSQEIDRQNFFIQSNNRIIFRFLWQERQYMTISLSFSFIVLKTSWPHKERRRRRRRR